MCPELIGYQAMKHQSLKTMYVLVGISILTYSCAPSVDSKVKKYSDAGKTIIASTMGQETKNHCIVFADAEGVYFDNMKSVSQLLLFSKKYTCVSSELSIPCDKKGLAIRMNSWEYTFSKENIDDFEIYPIGDWATVILGKNEPGADFPSFVMQNGSDTIFLINTFESWHSRYQLKYDYVSEAVEYEGVDEYGNTTTGVFQSVSMSKETGNAEDPENITIKLWGGYGRLQSDCDKLSGYFEGSEPDFYAWYHESRGCTSYSAELELTPEHFFDVNTVASITFDELKKTVPFSEVGSTSMYEQLAGAIYSKYRVDKEEKAKREKQEQIQYVLDQCVDIEKLASELRNEVAAERKYAGKQVLLNLNLSSINRIDSRYTYNQYILDAQYSRITLDETVLIDISCYTDDENFVELSYPHHCILAGELMVNVSSPTDLKFENCELFLY